MNDPQEKLADFLLRKYRRYFEAEAPALRGMLASQDASAILGVLETVAPPPSVPRSATEPIIWREVSGEIRYDHKRLGELTIVERQALARKMISPTAAEPSLGEQPK